METEISCLILSLYGTLSSSTLLYVSVKSSAKTLQPSNEAPRSSQYAFVFVFISQEYAADERLSQIPCRALPV